MSGGVQILSVPINVTRSLRISVLSYLLWAYVFLINVSIVVRIILNSSVFCYVGAYVFVNSKNV